MTTTRPALWPLHDLLGTNLTTPENSLFMQSGYPVGLPVPSADHNGKFRRNGDWHKYLDLNGLRNADWLDSATFLAYRLTVDSLQYNSGGNVLAGGATVGKRGTYLINATRIETDATFLNPIGAGDGVQGDPLVFPTATAPGRIWVYAKDDGTVRFASVGVGVADAPGADEISLIGVDINALGVVTDGAVTPTTLALPDHQLGVTIPLWLFGEGRRLRVSVTPDGNPAVLVEGGAGPGQRIDNDHATDPTLLLNNSNAAGTALDATGNAVVAGDVVVTGTVAATSAGVSPTVTGTNTSSGAGLRGINSSTGPGVSGSASGAGQAGVLGTSTLSAGVSGTGGGAGSGVLGIGGSTGDGVTGTGGATSGHGLAGTAQGASSHGVQGTGANQATSHGVNGIAVNTSAHGVRGTTAAAATTSSAGVRAEALGDGVALSALAVNGNAARLESDTTSPTRAPLVIVPQDADASTTQVGSLAINSARLNKIRHHDGTNYLSVHSSTKGWVFGVSTTSSGTNADRTGDICDVTITPEQTGTVIVWASGMWNSQNDTARMTIILKDITAGATVATSQPLNALDIDSAGTTGRVMSFTYRMPYTLPTAAARLFRVELDFTGGTVDWYDVMLTVQGVY